MTSWQSLGSVCWWSCWRWWKLVHYKRNTVTTLVSIHDSVLLRIKVKVKCTLVQALKFCTGRTAQRGSKGIALLFHDHGTRKGWGVSVTPQPLFTPGKDAVPIVQEAGWAPGPVWTGAENSPLPGFDPWTVQPVAIRYTDWATRQHFVE